jgi:hypothetical protein
MSNLTTPDPEATAEPTLYSEFEVESVGTFQTDDGRLRTVVFSYTFHRINEGTSDVRRYIARAMDGDGADFQVFGMPDPEPHPGARRHLFETVCREVIARHAPTVPGTVGWMPGDYVIPNIHRRYLPVQSARADR